jgi:hypothetical protein
MGIFDWLLFVRRLRANSSVLLGLLLNLLVFSRLVAVVILAVRIRKMTIRSRTDGLLLMLLTTTRSSSYKETYKKQSVVPRHTFQFRTLYG